MSETTIEHGGGGDVRAVEGVGGHLGAPHEDR
jgi:hypothetical protein